MRGNIGRPSETRFRLTDVKKRSDSCNNKMCSHRTIPMIHTNSLVFLCNALVLLAYAGGSMPSAYFRDNTEESRRMVSPGPIKQPCIICVKQRLLNHKTRESAKPVYSSLPVYYSFLCWWAGWACARCAPFEICPWWIWRGLGIGPV